jgi:hypothetical protein
LTLPLYRVYSWRNSYYLLGIPPPPLPNGLAKALADTPEFSMTRPRIQRQTVRNRRQTAHSKVKVRTFDVEHRRQPERLLHMLENRHLYVRQTAVVALARMSEQHPARLVRRLERLTEALNDDSAYVRWHIVYVLSRMIEFSSSRSSGLLKDLVSRLDDENRIVRVFACRTLRQIAGWEPQLIEELFKDLKREIPSSVVRALSALGPVNK